MPFRFLAFSDIHYHEYEFGSHVRDRLVDCSLVFCSIIDYAEENGIQHIVFGGDITHSKQTVTKRTISLLLSDLEWASRKGMKFIMIPGNHDFQDKSGEYNSLSYFESFGPESVLVADNFGPPFYWDSHDSKGNQIVIAVNAVPYLEDKQELLEKIALNKELSADFKILLAHTGIQNAVMGSDYITAKAHDLNAGTDLPPGYNCYLFGHYHEHQKVAKNAWIIGSTHQMNFSDAGGTRGFCDITINDDGTVDLKHVPTDEYIPKFHIVNEDYDFSQIRKQDFVKFESKETLSETVKEDIKGQLIAHLGDLPSVLSIVPSKKKDIGEDFQLSSKASSINDTLEEWVSLKKTDLNAEKLLALGRELLIEARNDVE